MKLASEKLSPGSISRDASCIQELQKNKGERRDFFEILHQCSDESTSWCWLLAEAVKHRVPILSVLASCIQVRVPKSLRSRNPAGQAEKGWPLQWVLILHLLGGLVRTMAGWELTRPLS